jgi:hypothetical protein
MVKLPTFVHCADGPLVGLRVYREGADWKEKDLVQIVRYKSPPWRRDGDGVWVQVFNVFEYQLVRTLPPLDELEGQRPSTSPGSFALKFVRDLN